MRRDDDHDDDDDSNDGIHIRQTKAKYTHTSDILCTHGFSLYKTLYMMYIYDIWWTAVRAAGLRAWGFSA